VITREQAEQLTHGEELHFGKCQVQIGERGGVHITQERVRVSGKVKLWKTRPSEFQVPIKYGMYQSGYVHDRNADDFHRACDCALKNDQWLNLVTYPILGNAHDDMSLMKGLRDYLMDSRNDLDKRAACVRRLSYVVGVHPPKLSNVLLVKAEVKSFYDSMFGSIETLLEHFPNLDPKEVE